MDFIQFETIDESQPRAAAYEDEEMFFGTEDTKPELCAPKKRKMLSLKGLKAIKNPLKNLWIHFKILKTTTTLSLIR